MRDAARRRAFVRKTETVLALTVAAACVGEPSGPTETERVASRSSPVVSDTIRFVVTGDFGGATPAEGDVAAMIASWAPDLVITVGDNNYPDGAASTIDANIGQFYHSFIYPYAGGYGAGADQNRFFPSLGNHDWNTAGAAPYLAYFTLPGNERYYDFVRGSVHFFAVDSDPHEPDGTSPTSTQGLWLKNALAAATERWKIVYFHHSPFTSGTENGPSSWMQWPFEQWGASLVLSGHEHLYERFLFDGFPYIVNGLGGEEFYQFGLSQPGSVARFTGDFGAMLATASSTSLELQFFDRNRVLVDSYAMPGTPALAMAARLTAESGPVNGQIDPGETVSVALALTNTGGNATNLVGTVVSNAGVTSPSGPQTYGAILGGNTVERSFSFTAAGGPGATITVALQAQDGSINVGTPTATFVLAAPPNPPPPLGGPNLNPAYPGDCTIPDVGVASPYPSLIAVSGLPPSPTKVTVTLTGLSHTYPDDLDILLVGPRGQTVVLMSDCGGGAALRSVNLTFDDGAASKLPDNTQISSGTFKPTNITTRAPDSWPAPAPTPGSAGTLASFAGVDPNGIWSLYILDDEAGDSGRLAGGWALHFSY
jgi:hypothetical protein